MVETRKYEISTGSKSDYYTLWCTRTIDLRPRDENGNIIEHYRRNSIGGNMYYHVRLNFVKNLSKDRDTAIAKVKEMGIDIPDREFDFDLKHYTKPSFEAFGTKLKYKNGKWYAEATKDFFEMWKNNKDELKRLGWSCWKQGNIWWMAVYLDIKQ